MSEIEVGRSKRDMARELRARGVSYRQIARELGIDICTTYYHCNPKKKAARALRQTVTRREHIREEGKRVVARGDYKVAYSFVRRALSSLDGKSGQTSGPEERSHLLRAVSGLYQAEDAIQAAAREADVS